MVPRNKGQLHPVGANPWSGVEVMPGVYDLGLDAIWEDEEEERKGAHMENDDKETR